MADKQTERIKFETELFRLLFLLAVATGGGAIGLLLGEPTTVRLLFAGVGLIVTVALSVVLWRQRRAVDSLIERIQEES